MSQHQKYRKATYLTSELASIVIESSGIHFDRKMKFFKGTGSAKVITGFVQLVKQNGDIPMRICKTLKSAETNSQNGKA